MQNSWQSQLLRYIGNNPISDGNIGVQINNMFIKNMKTGVLTQSYNLFFYTSFSINNTCTCNNILLEVSANFTLGYILCRNEL